MEVPHLPVVASREELQLLRGVLQRRQILAAFGPIISRALNQDGDPEWRDLEDLEDLRKIGKGRRNRLLKHKFGC